MKKIYIYQRVLPHYRIPFFEGLSKKLLEHGIKLIVVYGKEYPGSVPKSEITSCNWAFYKPNYYIKLFKYEFVLQTPVLSSFLDDSIIIIEQANRLLINYIFFIFSLLKIKRIAFWGHGKNFQSKNPDSFSEKIKRKCNNLVSWWFCYTEDGKGIIEKSGFCKENITIVYNSVDTKSLIQELEGLSQAYLSNVKKNLGITSDNVAIYCGGMYTEKRIEFLLQSCLKIRDTISDFEIIFIGDGPDSRKVQEFSDSYSWAHYLGAISGKERVAYFAISKCQLMPGLVGLGILDSFALLTPLITTNIDYHSPEVAYLNSGFNGLITENNLDSFAEQVASLLSSDTMLESLITGCSSSRKIYSIDLMVENYSNGVLELVSHSDSQHTVK